jgi:hypothetical protein
MRNIASDSCVFDGDLINPYLDQLIINSRLPNTEDEEFMKLHMDIFGKIPVSDYSNLFKVFDVYIDSHIDQLVNISQFKRFIEKRCDVISSIPFESRVLPRRVSNANPS